MRVALITPDALIETVAFRTNYLMVLPSELQRQEYVSKYRDAQLDDNIYIILDNGIAEGTSFGLVDLLDMADYIDADEIVVPDVMGDGLATCELVKRFEEGLLAKTLDKYAFMAVAQGKTWSEVFSCVEYYLSQDWINTIAFPRCLQSFGSDARLEVLEHWAREIQDSDKEVHLLGSTAMLDEIQIVRTQFNDYVRGVDTCMPFEVVRQGHTGSLSQGGFRYEGRGPGYFSWVPTPYEKARIDFNVETYLNWAGAPEVN